MKVGIISTVSIDHATPAAFYTHQLSRNYYHEIACDLAMSGFDFFGGGGFKDAAGKKAPAAAAQEQCRGTGQAAGL
jgi:alkaline phosphatase